MRTRWRAEWCTDAGVLEFGDGHTGRSMNRGVNWGGPTRTGGGDRGLSKERVNYEGYSVLTKILSGAFQFEWMRY